MFSLTEFQMQLSGFVCFFVFFGGGVFGGFPGLNEGFGAFSLDPFRSVLLHMWQSCVCAAACAA